METLVNYIYIKYRQKNSSGDEIAKHDFSVYLFILQLLQIAPTVINK